LIFQVIPPRTQPSGDEGFYLIADRWDDYTFQTQFYLTYLGSDGARNDIGRVKIARFGMGDRDAATDLEDSFERLGREYFSLGQAPEYYERLGEIDLETRDAVLHALRDMAADLRVFKRAYSEPVTRNSLMRSVSTSTIENQLHRVALGGPRLSAYSFSYQYPANAATKARSSSPDLLFEVTPNSHPPTNIHVIIGRNGVGKSLLLDNMTRILVSPQTRQRGTVVFHSLEYYVEPKLSRATYSKFANVVSVAFSAFDNFVPLSTDVPTESSGALYTYIGLKDATSSTKGNQGASLKSVDSLTAEFSSSVYTCIASGKMRLWRAALEMLGGDPIFSDAQFATLVEHDPDDPDLGVAATRLYDDLSSGHKIVLLTITRLVETIQERSLVLIDEPESHLHPPLLSAFIRALSNLLIERNGVAIIATHSPVVLQEVPRYCVWKLSRSGSRVTAERPKLETFGENVGVLTHEAFGLEVTHSGFHRLLMESVDAGLDYQEVLDQFEQGIGSEGRALLSAETAERREGA
jgi:predicted ATPase